MSVNNVLITDGAGVIGSQLADELLERGYLARALDALVPKVRGEGARVVFRMRSKGGVLRCA